MIQCPAGNLAGLFHAITTTKFSTAGLDQFAPVIARDSQATVRDSPTDGND
jgi:hypothetical protein